MMQALKGLSFLSTLLLVVWTCEANGNVQVQIKLGTVTGTKRELEGKVVNEFLGVPFAASPIGDLRFKRPQPLTEHADVQATEWPNICPQDLKIPMPFTTDRYNEDCLYLNIWSPPSKGSELKPILFFIHGGGYSIGSASQPMYNGLPFAALGDVVLVATNYRLGPLGFFYGGSDEAPGNMGMLDQTLALEWVQDNIKYFGGDPDRVTIFGESAGGMSVSNHLLSPQSRNLFRNAIPMSGVSLGNLIQPKAEILKRSRSLAKLAGCPDPNESGSLSDDTIACVRKVDPNVLNKLQDSPDMGGDGGALDVAFVPIYGDQFLPDDPKVSLRTGDYKKNCSIMVGVVDDEGALFDFLFRTSPKLKELYSIDQPDIWKNVMRQYFALFHAEPQLTEDIIDVYFSSTSGKRPAKQAVTNAIGDFVLTCPTLLFGEKVLPGNNVHGYVISYKGTGSKDGVICTLDNGVCHGTELFTLFGIPTLALDVFNDDDRTAAKELVRIWSSFAKNDGADWPAFRSTSEGLVIPRVLDINPVAGNKVKTDFRYVNCKLFEKQILD